MKKTFFEYYIFSDKERVKNIWNDSIIILDTSVLLNLYRYSEEAKNNLLEVLEHYKNRLWIPYQVGWEYHQDRVSVYMDMNAAYDQIAAVLDRETDKFIRSLNLSKYSRHPKIETKWFEDQIKACTTGLRDQLLNMKDSCTDYSVKDEINERITELFDGKVGDDFDDYKLKELYKEGQVRYSEKVPPGYCDAKDKKDSGNRHLYGDLIWWKQVIKEACEKESNVILVTDDVKEDWYERVKGKTIGPRKELLREFRNETKMDILIYPTPKFLEYAKEYMSVLVNQETISEANEIHREDEAVGDIISLIPGENDDAVKIFTENPWMSAESFLQTYLNPINGGDLAVKYPDILGKNSLNPLEGIAGITSENSSIFGASVLDSLKGKDASVTKYTDIFGKKSPSSMESIARIISKDSSLLGVSVLDSLKGLDGSTTNLGIHNSTIHGDNKSETN